MENFYLNSDEELFSIIDRIKRGQDNDIVLVVPSGLSALRSIINLRILKEEAISLGINISIITSDSLIKKLALQSGLRILDKEAPKEKKLFSPKKEKEDSWPEQLKQRGQIRPQLESQPPITRPEAGRKVISDIIGPVEKEVVEPVVEPEPKEETFKEPFREPVREEEIPITRPVEEEEEIFYKAKKEKTSFKFFTKKKVVALLIIIGLIAGGFIVYFVLPRAQIVIDPKKETVQFETDITADRNTDSIILSDNSIPGQVFQIEMEDSKKFPTTGEKDIEEKAKGTIIVYNQYSSSDQTLVKTTRFLSDEGKIFRLTETTVIPGATIEEGEIIPSTKEVDVEADEAGEAYNIGPSNFKIPGFEGTPKYTAFYGRSIDPMAGGAKGKMRVATEDDIEGAMEIVSVELKNKVQEQFDKKIPDDLKLLKDSQILEVTESESSLEADQPGKEFLITIKAKAWGLAFRENDIFSLIEESISDKISENKILLSSSIKIDYGETEIDLARGKATFSCKIEADAAWKINEQVIKDKLAGKDEIEVRKYLSSLSEIEGAKVIFWPFWVKRIPRNENKIKITIEGN